MTQTRWTPEQANAWYAQQPWPVGCNFIPSTAINQLEMWQAESYDPPTIDRFHDIFRPDGTVYDPQEIAAIKAATGK